MRLFTGISIPHQVRDPLERLVNHLRPFAQLRWSPAYNLHITTKFIGEWPAERLEDLKSALAELPPREAIEVAIHGLGWFPNPHNPRIFWAALQAPPTLGQLARDTNQLLLDRLQIPFEAKPFAPHLTLARVPHEVPLTKLREAIASLESVDFGRFTIDHFHLYLSEAGPSGSIYTRLAEFPLTAA